MSSVCRLFVTLLHSGQRLALFGNIFAPPINSRTRTVCVKILRKNWNEFWGIVLVKYKGYEKLAFSPNISLYFENDKRYGHSYNKRRIGTRMRSIEWCHFQ